MAPSATSIIRTRFAPSPSGHLHVGGARTALFCWAFAKGRNGRFMLRIEDTDQKRSSDAASVGFLKDLKWLGIDWDEGPEFEGSGGGDAGPYFQSERLGIYHKLIEKLISEGKAYRAFETAAELDAARAAARAAKQNYRYDRASWKLPAATVQQYLGEKRPHVVRLLVPQDKPIVIHDEVLGDVRVEAGEMDDFVILKADTYPTYHFAVVVDDELMGVTHVIRAQEHLNNTPKHAVLQDALGYRRPIYAHVSIITNPDGSKMSKRDKDKALRAAVTQRKLTGPPNDTIAPDRWTWWISDKDRQLDLEEANRLAEALGVQLPEINVDDFRRAGYLPEVMINYLALLGWSPGENVEKFDREFFIRRFDLDRVVKTPAKFDRAKLLAFNLDAIQAMPADEFVQKYRVHAAEFHPDFVSQLSPAQFELLARANQKRSKTLDDTFRSSRFLIDSDDRITYEPTKELRKALAGGEPSGFAQLESLLPHLETINPWTVQKIESALAAYAEQHCGGQLGRIAQPLRVAVSGGTVSPAIHDTLAILGKESTINRIRRCLSTREQMLQGTPA